VSKTPEILNHPGYIVAVVLALLGGFSAIAGAETQSQLAQVVSHSLFGGAFTAAGMEYAFGKQ
jgi:hypothetical protein